MTVWLYPNKSNNCYQVLEREAKTERDLAGREHTAGAYGAAHSMR